MEIDGFLVIDKEKDWTSHDVVNKTRSIFDMKKIGHSGTLDPMATGVLILALGRYTRLLEYIIKQDKVYIAKIKFGEISDSFDITGNIEKKSNEMPEIENIKNILKKFLGNIEQIPPKHSAIKINGKRAYKQLKKIDEMPSRKVNVEYINIISYNYPYLEIEVKCSSGFYVRSLANDIGKELECGAVLADLRRTKIGDVDITNTIKINEIDQSKVKKFFDIYKDINIIKLDTEEYQKVKNGVSLNKDRDPGIVALTYKDELIAIGKSKHKIIKVEKVFVV